MPRVVVFSSSLAIVCHASDIVEVANMSILLPVLTDYWTLSHWHLAAFSSFTFLGMGLGAVILGAIADHYGRRPVFLLSLFVSSFFGLASAFAPDIYWFIMFRFFMGFGYGGNLVTDFVLFAEYVTASHRGRYMALTDVFYGTGSLVCVLLAWLIIPSIGWRYMVAITSIPAALMLFFRSSIPESPRYLAMRRQYVEVVQVLLYVAEENKVDDSIKAKISVLKERSWENVDAEQSQSYGELFNKYLWRVTAFLTLVWFFNSFASCLYIWLPLYMKESGATLVSDSLLCSRYNTYLST